MTRFGVAFAMTPLAWAQRPVLEARFIGNMAFAISDGSVTVMTDFPDQPGYADSMITRLMKAGAR
jgi:hypothetical protein